MQFVVRAVQIYLSANFPQMALIAPTAGNAPWSAWAGCGCTTNSSTTGFPPLPFRHTADGWAYRGAA